jgi:hypothetical protein
MGRKDCFICLDKRNAFWRMDSEAFMRFMSHVTSYFGLNGAGHDLDLEEVLYAEIAGEDLDTVSAIFGGYSPDENRILLVPVHPQRFILPAKNYFDLFVYGTKNEIQRSISLKAI